MRVEQVLGHPHQNRTILVDARNEFERLVRLGAQLCDASGSIIDRDYARAWLPETLVPGSYAQVTMDVPAPATPGRYALKFDLVSEGIDWFERCGSPTTVKPLWVR